MFGLCLVACLWGETCWRRQNNPLASHLATRCLRVIQHPRMTSLPLPDSETVLSRVFLCGHRSLLSVWTNLSEMMPPCWATPFRWPCCVLRCHVSWDRCVWVQVLQRVTFLSVSNTHFSTHIIQRLQTFKSFLLMQTSSSKVSSRVHQTHYDWIFKPFWKHPHKSNLLTICKPASGIPKPASGKRSMSFLVTSVITKQGSFPGRFKDIRC